MNDLAGEVAKLDWYHTIDLPDGVVTSGLFDHRRVVERYGLPTDLTGKRVLDVGTFDGFFAFEFERRGASEVVAIDVAGRSDLDLPASMSEAAAERFRPRSINFELAKDALGSRVHHVTCSAYDASPERLGTFDYVFVGSLLVHLRDPVRALMSLRTVCEGEIQLGEHTEGLLMDTLYRRPSATFDAAGAHLVWWVPNRLCLEHWLTAAGFVDVRRGRSFSVPFRARRGGIRHSVVYARSP